MNEVKDLTGIRFGKLVAVSATEERQSRYVVWRCQCDCGNMCNVDSRRLQRGTVTNCGCEPKEKQHRGPVPKDLTGMVFGKLKVLERAENLGTRTAWLCRCDCGNEIVVPSHDLRSGRKKNCGCKLYSYPYFRDLTGQRFGYLTVVNKTERRDYKGSIIWNCHCDCGKDVLYSADILMRGQIKSCGCYRQNEIRKKIHEKLHRIDGTCIERLNIKKPRSDNKSGHVGVHKVNDNCFQAVIGFQGKRYYLGTFSTLEEAIEARQRGERIHMDYLKTYYNSVLEKSNK